MVLYVTETDPKMSRLLKQVYTEFEQGKIKDLSLALGLNAIEFQSEAYAMLRCLKKTIKRTKNKHLTRNVEIQAKGERILHNTSKFIV